MARFLFFSLRRRSLARPRGTRKRAIALQRRHHAVGKQAHVELGLLVGHAAVAELRREMVDAGGSRVRAVGAGGFVRRFVTFFAVAAALLLTTVLWHRQPQGELPVAEGVHSTVEDLDLLADGEGLELIEGWDGSFYEWAVDQTDVGGETDG